MTTVLVVDDEAQIRRALGLNLRARGYDVVEADTGERALQAVADLHPSLVLLDLGLPGIDGIQVIHALRGWTNVPIIVLTVREDERSKVDALDAGADDYVTKPFGMAELLARLRSMLRRAPDPGAPDPEIVTPAFRLDVAAHQVFALPDEVEVRLTATEWQIVEVFVRHPGRLLTHRQLMEAVWGSTYLPDPNLLRVHIGHIRRKLEREPARPQHFVTDSGMGYRFRVDDGT